MTIQNQNHDAAKYLPRAFQIRSTVEASPASWKWKARGVAKRIVNARELSAVCVMQQGPDSADYQSTNPTSESWAREAGCGRG
jgi:hypothetical protein